jgi:hypothetical protein
MVNCLYYLLQRSPLATKSLSLVGIIPDLRIFQFAKNFCQTLRLFSILKGTPSELQYALAGL